MGFGKESVAEVGAVLEADAAQVGFHLRASQGSVVILDLLPLEIVVTEKLHKEPLTFGIEGELADEGPFKLSELRGGAIIASCSLRDKKARAHASQEGDEGQE